MEQSAFFNVLAIRRGQHAISREWKQLKHNEKKKLETFWKEEKNGSVFWRQKKNQQV